MYDSGCAIYSYFGFQYRDDMPEEQALWIYEEVERECKEATYKHFGSLSHHHGIGKIRKMFGKASMGEAQYDWFTQIKQNLDPQNVFAADNIISVRNKTDKDVKNEDKNPFKANEHGKHYRVDGYDNLHLTK